MSMLPVNYATEESFKAYIDYLALKRHFTTDDYDYHKYNGKVRASFTSYQTRNDAFFFYKLSQKKDWRHMLLANVVENPNIWVRDLCEESSEQIYFDWKRKTDAISHHFTTELSKIKPELEDNFICNKGSHPYLMSLYLKKTISREFFTVLTHITNVFPYWDAQMSGDVVAKGAIRTAKKYFPFLAVDKKKFTTLLKSHVN